MDTKLKKSNPLLSWLAFFIGINLIVASTIGGIFLASHYDSIGTSDYKDTVRFKAIINTNFEMLFQTLTGNQDYTWGSTNLTYFSVLENEQNIEKQVIKTNMEIENYNEAVDYLKNKPGEYNYLFIWDGSHFSIIDDTKSLDPYGDEVYSEMIDKFKTFKNPSLNEFKVIMGVKSRFSTHGGGIYNSYLEWKTLNLAVPVVGVCFIIGVILLIFSSIKRTSRKEFSGQLAYYSGKLWLEVKAVISLFMLFLVPNIDDSIGVIIIAAIYFWWAYLMLLDLCVNKKHFFTNNSINWVLKLYHSYENKKPFQKGMLIRLLSLVGTEIVLILLSLASLESSRGIFSLLFVGLGVYLFYIYLNDYRKLIDDIGRVVDHTKLIRNGDLNTKLILPVESPMHKTAEDLSNIQEGVFIAVQEQLKSERMKIELITNVSHDLKTPLTAMVNYIDLLGRETLSPEHTNDYVKVLSKKAARLTSLTQDIFDISKAQSGNIELNIERIDIVELINQSIAELDDKIQESKLSFKIDLPQEKIYINADGRKLYRVFDNLISNILKYSQENTRVYIDLREDEDSILISFKNIASYEMNISADDLMERFVRGDESRTTEGSGLGLAIVQSFVALCGGSFEIKIDGDLFKAIVKFKKG
ncbi:MAG: hypothetical protein K0R09_91 [Clostridiales bacterium]|nr:hypothetical protein [Clostridiales bacterium]